MLRKSISLSVVVGCLAITSLLASMGALGQSPPTHLKDSPIFSTLSTHTLASSGLANVLSSPASSDSADLPKYPWVINIPFETQSQVNLLANHFDVWSVDQKAMLAVAMVDESNLAHLAQLGFEWELDAERMADLLHIRSLREQVRSASAGDGDSDGIPQYECYRTVEETYASMQALAANHPQLVQFKDIGDSWDKVTDGGPPGYDMHALVLTNQANSFPKPKFFLLATVHAREFTPAELAMRFAERLVNEYSTNPDIAWLLDYGEIHVVPLGNPDGRKEAEQLVLWRKNRNLVDGSCSVSFPSASSHGGVDLNRNSSFLWNSCSPGQNCSSSNVCAQTYRGTGPASEPETQALEGYMRSIFSDTKPITASLPAALDTNGLMITLHSYSELIIFPWGWTTNASPNDAELITLARKFGYYTDYQVCRAGAPGCLYLTDGTNDDWAYGELGVAAYTFELGTEFFQSCSVFEDDILDKNMDALIYAAKASRLPYQLPSGPEITDINLSTELISTTTLLTVTAVADDSRYTERTFGDDEPTQAISTARISIDLPAWITATETYSMATSDGLFSSTVASLNGFIDTSGWQPGNYTVFVEAQDSDGNWGVPKATSFQVAREQFEAELLQYEGPLKTRALGDSVPYSLTINNLGWSSDLYTLSVTSTFQVELPESTITIASGQSAIVELSVQVPSTVTEQLSRVTQITDTLTFVVESQGEAQEVARIQLTTAAAPYRRYFPFLGVP